MAGSITGIADFCEFGFHWIEFTKRSENIFRSEPVVKLYNRCIDRE